MRWGFRRIFCGRPALRELTESVSQMLERGKPVKAHGSGAGSGRCGTAEAEKLKYVVMVPVLGKKSAIGLLVLGSAGPRKLTAEELEFLETCGRQLGIAIENFRLLEQALRSQRQWRNTFDSVHDIILAHDAEFRIIKANQILLEQVELAAADVIGSTANRYCRTGWASGRDVLIARAGARKSAKEPTRVSADSRWSPLLPIRSREASRRGRSTSFATSRSGGRRKRNTVCCSSRCRRACMWPRLRGRLLDCNDAFVHMLGYDRREELLTLNLDEDIRVDAGQREAFRREIEQQNYVRNFEVTMRRKNGTLLLAAESSFATRDAAGRSNGFRVLCWT